MPDITKTARERDANTRKMNMGIGTKDIPNNAKKQSLGLNIGGGILTNVSKKNDPFRKENFGSMNIKGGVSIHDIVRGKKRNFF